MPVLSAAERAHNGRVFEILPAHAELPSLILEFNELLTSLDVVRFAGWHTHYGTTGVFGLATALREVRDLVQQVTSVVLCVGLNGEHLSGTVARVDARPTTISKGPVRLRRVVFDRGAWTEDVHYDRYEEGAYYWSLR
jgi:hypothetical protein